MDRLPEGLLLVPSGAPDQMHYGWWRRLDSNQRHRAYETPALPTELRRHDMSCVVSGWYHGMIEKRSRGVKVAYRAI